MATEHVSFCRICAAACGMVVTVEDQQVLRVRGDAEHPISRGYVCAKARGLPDWHHSASRLDRPRLRGRDSGWADVLDDLGARIRETIDSHGRDTVGLYLATGLAYDSAGQIAAGTFMRALGSTSFYTAATVDNAPVLVAAELVAGNAMLNPVWNPHAPGLLVLIGTNPVVSHGYGTTLPDPVRHLRDYRRAGGRVWVVDPRRTESAQLADRHLAVQPGSDVEILAAVARSLMDTAEGDDAIDPAALDELRSALAGYTADRAAAAAGVDADDIEQLIAEVKRCRGRVAMFCGTGTTMARDGIVTEWLRWVILILSASLDNETGMRFNRGIVNRLRPPRPGGPVVLAGPASRPELGRVAGQLPAVAMVDEIESGRLRTLIITGGNPLTAFPEPQRVRAALRSLKALAVIDVSDGELCDLATHVLPATGQLERADVTLAEHVSIRSGIQSTRAVVDAVSERRPVWWMLQSIERRVNPAAITDGPTRIATGDHDYIAGALAHAAMPFEEIVAAGPHGVDVPPEFGWVRATMLSDGRWNIAPQQMLDRLQQHLADAPADREHPLLLTPRREMAWSNSVRFGGTGLDGLLRLHPEDAAAAGLDSGDTAMVESAHGSTTATVAIDGNVRPGVVSMTHGHGAHNTGHMTSSSIDVDPLTAMPLASGLAVTVRRADGVSGRAGSSAR